jgi:hypothetical protein
MKFRTVVIVIALIFLSGCENMKPTDFKNSMPRLEIEKYFAGKTQAWGIFEDRFGKLRRQFTVDITGTWDGKELTLVEQFQYRDGEHDERIWRITKTGDHAYEGKADDIIGVAKGESYGNSLNWQYDMDLKIGGSTVQVHFNDWMYLQPSGVLLNRARVTKLGIEIGSVTLSFLKLGEGPAISGLEVNDWLSSGGSMQAANQ